MVRCRQGEARGCVLVAESERGPGLGAAASWSREGSRRVLSKTRAQPGGIQVREIARYLEMPRTARGRPWVGAGGFQQGDGGCILAG